jgi:prolipoprotein diacylglyceryltransferase
MYDTLIIPSLGLALSTQQLVFWTAVLLGTVLGPVWIARREHLDVSRLRAAQGVLALFGLAGARAHFVFNNPNFYDAHPLRAIIPWGGGMHMAGAIIGLCIAAPIAARRYRLPIAKLGDGLIVVTAVAYAGTRIGCLLGGCCFGTRCDRAWAVTYPPGSLPFTIQREAGLIAADAAASLPVHPAQLYFLLAALFSAAVAVAVGRRKRYDGQVFWVGLTLLAATTVLVEPFRALENHRVMWAGIPQLVWTELALTVVGLAGLVASVLRHRRADAAPPDATAELVGVTGR